MITFDNKSGAFTVSASTLTWQHTVGTSSSKYLLVVGVSIEKTSGATVQSVTYDGVLMAPGNSVVGGNGIKADLRYLIAPHAGTHPVVVTFTTTLGADGAVAGAVSLSGTNQTTPVPTTATSSGSSSTSPSTPITTVTDAAWIIDVVAFDSVKQTLTANGGQTQRWNTLSGPFGSSVGILGAGSTLATTVHGAHMMSWTPSSMDNWAQVVAEIRP